MSAAPSTRPPSRSPGPAGGSRRTRRFLGKRGGLEPGLGPSRFSLAATPPETLCSPVSPWATRSWMAARKGATPVPGPTMITGVSGVFGNVRPPDRTHRGTRTGPIAGGRRREAARRPRALAQDWLWCTRGNGALRTAPCPREPGSPCPGSRDASQLEQRPRRGSLRRVWYCTTATRICSLEGWAWGRGQWVPCPASGFSHFPRLVPVAGEGWGRPRALTQGPAAHPGGPRPGYPEAGPSPAEKRQWRRPAAGSGG